MIKLVLIDSCENFFDKQNRIAGWYDVGLSQQGMERAKDIANKINQQNIKVDYSFLSVLLRAEQTYNTIAKELGYKIRNFKSWKLNERHFGKLQGLSYQKTQEIYGENIFDKLKADGTYMPPKLAQNDQQNPNNDELYAGLKETMPLAESLDDVFSRSTNYLTNFIFKTIKPNQTAIIVSHKEVIKCLHSYFCKQATNKEQFYSLKNNIFVFELTDDYKLSKNYCL